MFRAEGKEKGPGIPSSRGGGHRGRGIVCLLQAPGDHRHPFRCLCAVCKMCLVLGKIQSAPEYPSGGEGLKSAVMVKSVP